MTRLHEWSHISRDSVLFCLELQEPGINEGLELILEGPTRFGWMTQPPVICAISGSSTLSMSSWFLGSGSLSFFAWLSVSNNDSTRSFLNKYSIRGLFPALPPVD